MPPKLVCQSHRDQPRLHRDAENAAIVANLGLIFMNQGHYDEGIRWLEEQLDIAERAEDKQGLTTLYTNLGIIYLEKSSLDSALLCLEKGLDPVGRTGQQTLHDHLYRLHRLGMGKERRLRQGHANV
jgi:tetratricopeptide (TPR) repeat protein